MHAIRPFTARDIPEVARVHQAAFKLQPAPALDSYRRYLTDTFLQNPAGGGTVPSLVCEDDGRVVGFVGLVPRRVTANRKQFQALVSSQFIVDPASCVGLVALRLAKAYLEGPQDLSIADEANDVSRRIWEGLGGTTALLQSLYWTRPLRPARLATSCLRERRGFATAAAAASPLAALADGMVTRLPGSHFRQTAPAADAEDVRPETLLRHADAFQGRGALRVEYDHRTLQWLLDRVACRSAGRRPLAAVVTRDDSVLGWYVASLGSDGVAEVAQLAANPSSIHEVLRHLFYEAWRRGAVAAAGRLEPQFMQAMSETYCLFHRRGPWVLIKTDKPELLQSFQSGDAYFSRLDGEWSLRFERSHALSGGTLRFTRGYDAVPASS